MRKVTFKAWRDGDFVDGMEGVFHQWGLAPLEDGSGAYSVGIIEMDGGRIITAHPEHIQFTDDKVPVTREYCKGETVVVGKNTDQ